MKGKFIIINSAVADRACAFIRSLPHDEPHSVVIAPHKSTRSLAQNNTLWLWLDTIRIHIADTTGSVFSAEELHEWFKTKFLPARIVEVNGEAVPVRRTTTKLNTKEMAEYLDAIDRYCADSMHLWLPQPEDMGR